MKSTDKWWFYQDSKGQWRWKRTTHVGKIVGYSPGYPSKEDCIAHARLCGYIG